MNAKLIPLTALAACLVCFVTSPALSQPGPSTTGPLTPDNELRRISSITITEDGTVLEGVWITGMVDVRADDVTIRDFKIDATSYYGIKATYGARRLTIEDGEIFGMSSAAVYGGNFEARRIDIHDSGADGFKPTSNALIEKSWLRRLGSKPESHADGVQIRSGSDVVIRENYFDMPSDLPGFNNSICIIVQTGSGPVDNILIQDNWINGGGFSVQVRDKGRGYGPPTNVRINDNRFGRDFQFGPWVTDGDVRKDGNVWSDTGALLAGQDSSGDDESMPDDPLMASPPRFSPAGGNFLNPTLIAITTATPNAKIHYATDGSTPDSGAASYSEPLNISSTSEIRAIAIADGLAHSPVTSAEYAINEFTSTSEWGNVELPTVTGSVNIRLSMQVAEAAVDSVLGLSEGPSEGYEDMGPIVRFAPSGIIDARNESRYEATDALVYRPGVEYEIRMRVDVKQRSYSVWVTPSGGQPALVASNFAFRSEQSGVASLSNLGFRSLAGSAILWNVVISAGSNAPPKPPLVRPLSQVRATHD